MAVEIPLTRGFVALVDPEDAEWVFARKWRVLRMRGGRIHYAVTDGRGEEPRTVSMHRLITGAPKGLLVDHRDHDGLNNRRDNLRVATATQNVAHSRRKPNKHGFIGIILVGGNRYYGRVKINGWQILTSSFSAPADAARARDELMLKCHGEFASTLNFPELREAR